MLMQGSERNRYKILGNLWTDEDRATMRQESLRYPKNLFGQDQAMVGTLLIHGKEEEKKMRIINLGFDWNFNPICIIQMSDIFEENQHGYQCYYIDDRGVMKDTEQLIKYSNVLHRIATHPVIISNTKPYALRGDRVDGLEITLLTSSPVWNCYRLSMTKEHIAGETNWVFMMFETKDDWWGKLKGI